MVLNIAFEGVWEVGRGELGVEQGFGFLILSIYFCVSTRNSSVFFGPEVSLICRKSSLRVFSTNFGIEVFHTYTSGRVGLDCGDRGAVDISRYDNEMGSRTGTGGWQ